MARWYFTAPAVLIAAVVGASLNPVGLVVGPLVVMAPIWGLRVRSSQSLDTAIRRVGQEVQDSIQMAFAAASAVLVVLLMASRTIFAGLGDLLGVLASQAAQVPLPLAYISTSVLGYLGLDSGSLTAAHFGGIAIILFALAYAAKGVR